MDKKAFFLQGDSLLLPADYLSSQAGEGLPVDFSNEFKETDIFQIPAIDVFDGPEINVVSVPKSAVLPENWKSIPIRQLLSLFSTVIMGDPRRLLRACHIAQWRHDSQYCGVCGAKNINIEGEPHRRCSKCRQTEFPRICPAVITAITDDENRILLAHNKRHQPGVYSHISGFNEAGETLEETVVREIREEINITVKDIIYIKSQPWPFPASLMVGFKASFSSGTIRPDGEEIEDAQWFTADKLPNLPGEGSLSRNLINLWLSGKL